MIVRQQPDDSLIFITQNDHAKLSGIFAAHWGNDRFARLHPYESTVRAAVFHDCGWYRYDTKPRYDVATRMSPTFFQVPLDEEQLAAFQWGIDWLGETDPYAGLLIGRHRTGLWRNRYDTLTHPALRGGGHLSAEVEDFLARNEPSQREAIEAFGRREFEINFHLLQVWDLLSLYVCTSEPKPDYIEPVPSSYDNASAAVRMTLTPLDSGRVVIDPYPFDVAPLPVSYIYRHLPTRIYPDVASFRIAYFGAPLQLRTFAFVPPTA